MQSHTPVKQKGDCTSSRSIMTRPGATACRFSTCNTRHHALPLRLLLAEGAGAAPPHLEDVEAAARQQQNFSLCKDVFISFPSLAKAARVRGEGGGGAYLLECC